MEEFRAIICENQPDIERAFSVRRAVFVGEQHIDPGIERDAHDLEDATHFLVLDGDIPIGAGRYHPTESGIKIGRMAVLEDYRRQGVGRLMIKAMLASAKQSGFNFAELNAQATARSFYYAMGFVDEGEPFFEAGLPHIKMVRDLTNR